MKWADTFKNEQEIPQKLRWILTEFTQLKFKLCFNSHEKGWAQWGLDKTLQNICQCTYRTDDNASCVHNSSSLIEGVKRRAQDVLRDLRNFDMGTCTEISSDFLVRLRNALEINERFWILLDNNMWIGYNSEAEKIGWEYLQGMKDLAEKIHDKTYWPLFQDIVNFAHKLSPVWYQNETGSELYPYFCGLKMRFNTWQNEVLWGLQQEVREFLPSDSSH